MELIIISESRIKLMLTPDDMASYTGNTREVLREIMHDASRKCGCHPMEGRVFVQMYPSREGGCELFVTRLEDRRLSARMADAFMRGGEERTLTEFRRCGFRERHIIYSFETMQDLLNCCLGLWQMGYSGASAAYADRGRRVYFLLLDQETVIAGEHFGTLCPSQTYYYISEHCDVICPDQAAEKLGRLA